MRFHKSILVLPASRSSLVLAQQPCYWPDGSSLTSDQGNWMNCYSSQASACCLNGDSCLSNGLCYGAYLGQTYRGGCTVKDWSNTTACPTQWCNDVTTAGASNLWKCPPAELHNGTGAWWCGNEREILACQLGISASFIVYTSGSILGFPPVTLSSSALTKIPSNVAATTLSPVPNLKATTVSTSSSANLPVPAQTQEQSTNLPTDSAAPAQTQQHSTSLPTAIGVGIGVPLGIATIGFLGFTFWKEAVRQRKSKPRILSQTIGSKNGGQVGAAAIHGPWNDSHEVQLPRELDDRGRTELSNSEIKEM